MKTILKPIFEMITGEYTLFDNILYNYLAMAVVGAIAFGIAFAAVGKLYGEGVIAGRSIGSLLHWIIRLIVFIIIFYVLHLFIWGVQIFLSLPWWGIFLIIALIIAVIVAIRRRSF